MLARRSKAGMWKPTGFRRSTVSVFMNLQQTKSGSPWWCASSCVVALTLLAFGSQAVMGQALDDGQKSKRTQRPLAAKTTSVKTAVVRLTEAQEDSALAFAKQHHPELATLLEQLRKKSSSGFSRGTREIHQAAQRLERIRDKQPARFEAELANWQLDSEIRLLTAKWTMSKDTKLVKRIQALLRARQVAKIDRLKAERDRLSQRLHQLDQQIGMGTEELDADLAAEWQRLAKRSTVTAKAQKNRAAKPAEATATAKQKKAKTKKTE